MRCEGVESRGYSDHWTRSRVETGLALGELRKSEIYIPADSGSGYVRMAKYGEEDWLVRWNAALNRAIDGDQVFFGV